MTAAQFVYFFGFTPTLDIEPFLIINFKHTEKAYISRLIEIYAFCFIYSVLFIYSFFNLSEKPLEQGEDSRAL